MAEIHTNQLAKKAIELRKAGASEKEIRRRIADLERELEAKDAEAAEAAENKYARGLSDRDRAALEIDRASTGQRPLVNPEDDRVDEPDHRRELSARDIASLEFERAVSGLPALSATDIDRINLARLRGEPTDSKGEEIQAPAYAPKGMSERQRATINLNNACRGLPELLPYQGDE